jgi:hypothetical protein
MKNYEEVELSSFNGTLHFAPTINNMLCIERRSSVLTPSIPRHLDAYYWSVFEKCPQAAVLFGFPIDIDPNATPMMLFHYDAAYLIHD